MDLSQHSGQGPLAHRYDYADQTILAFDLGLPEDAVSVDIVDGTAILVIESDDESRTEEFDIPAGDAGVFMNNGVLTIVVDQ